MDRTLGSVTAPGKPAGLNAHSFTLFHTLSHSFTRDFAHLGGLQLTVRHAGGAVHVSVMVS